MCITLARWKSRTPALASFLLLSISAFAQTPSTSVLPDLAPAQMREDLKFLKGDWARQDKSFTTVQRLEFERIVDETATAADQLSEKAFALEVMRAVALARNGHTVARAANMMNAMPVKAWWFADGLYIVKAQPELAHLISARIEKLGTFTADEALAKVAPFISGTDQRIRFLSANLLTSPDILEHVGVASGPEIPLTLRLADGSTKEVKLGAASTPDPGDKGKNINRGYTVLVPDELSLEGRWNHVLDPIKKRSPLYTKRTDVTTSWLEDKKVFYIRLDTVSSIDDTPLDQKFADIFRKSLLPSIPKFIVIDLRLNSGGDFFNTILFSQSLPRLVTPKGRILVLVSRATFSAGISTAAMLKGASLDNVTLVGETMGDSGQFWSEGETIPLPNSKIGVEYSNQFEDYENGCTDPATCFWAVVAFGPKGISLTPEVRLDVTFADYAAGRDPVLETALSLAK
ncbi:peptidase S41 [Phyllobacterium sp. SB3]|uniref:peptidase S41 n=1 Tax=Phyllobacterium sp. SB3 TaxID=3156073 RepID=UPI0032AF0298